MGALGRRGWMGGGALDGWGQCEQSYNGGLNLVPPALCQPRDIYNVLNGSNYTAKQEHQQCCGNKNSLKIIPFKLFVFCNKVLER